MTNEEAKKIIFNQWQAFLDDNIDYAGISEAYKMAINALDQQSKPIEKFDDVKTHIQRLAGDYKCWDNRLTWEEALELNRMLEAQPCEDCISREEVQDLISRWLSDYLLDETREALETINYKVGDMPSVTPRNDLATTSQDCISRQAVLMELGKYLCGVPYEKGIDAVIKELPPVTPKPKTDVLDKLRAEMEQLKHQNTDVSGYRWWNNAIDNCLYLIDDYKAESEDKE